jgi:predicted nucleic acid-binding protein
MMADTSALIELLRNTGSRCHQILLKTIQDDVAIWLPAVVVQEVLQGAKNPSEFMKLRAALEAFRIFEPQDYLGLHQHAAMLYARCRWQGLTPRSPMDCVVAACAIEAELSLLANDRDFTVIARIEPKLKLLL